jgi:subtilisin family serine protease
VRKYVNKVLVFGAVLLLVALAFGATAINVCVIIGTENGAVGSEPMGRGAMLEVDSAIPFEGTADSAALSSSSYEVIPWWVDMVDAEPQDISNQGENVYVAVLDTGLIHDWKNFLPEANVATELGKGFTQDLTWNSAIGDYEWGPVEDDRGFITRDYGCGHGTHVASTIIGFDLYGMFDVRGVAPKVTIIPVLVLDTWFLDCPDPDYYNDYWREGAHDGKLRLGGSGWGTWEMVAAGINYIADLADDLDGPVVISMSLGSYPGDEQTQIMDDAIDNAIDNGVIVVAAAGNAGTNGMGYPAAYSPVISVAAGGWTEMRYPDRYWWRGDRKDVPEKLNTKDVYGNNWQHFLALFSSRPNKDLGQKSTLLDMTAPGVDILGPYEYAIYWTGSYWRNLDRGIYWLSGTSMATPHVSAIAALVLEDYPDLEQDEMEVILKNAARKLPLAADGALVMGYIVNKWHGTDWGAGFLQADAALKSASVHAKN